MKPWFIFPPELAHKFAPSLLKTLSIIRKPQLNEWNSFSWRNLSFSNPIGTAGGVDKTGDSIKGFWTLGVGFLEVGTVTPQPQEANPGKILDRSIKNKALWNKMGFPNDGAQSLKKKLSKLKTPHFTPIFVNIGKNRWTTLDEAHFDYIKCIEELSDYADTFVINISSPNTTDLRKLFEEKYFKNFLTHIIDAHNAHSNKMNKKPCPILLKLSPDLTTNQLKLVLDASYELGIDGWILTNTKALNSSEHPYFQNEGGGVSGAPLAKKSKELLQECIQILGDRRKGKLIVSCGGILSSDDVKDRLSLGADLVQVYSALIFNGLNFFNSVTKSSL